MFPEATHRKPLPRGASSLSSVVTEVGTANAPGDVPYLKRETLVTMFGRKVGGTGAPAGGTGGPTHRHQLGGEVSCAHQAKPSEGYSRGQWGWRPPLTLKSFELWKIVGENLVSAIPFFSDERA